MSYTTRYSWRTARKEIEELIARGEVKHLTVDVFDTLLLRTTTPEDVISATSRWVADELGVEPDRVIEARGEAWKIESARSVGAGRCPDATSTLLFSTWISLLAPDCQDASLVARKALEHELVIEAACLEPNLEMRALLETARAAGVEVTALSDMYLSPDEVRDLLASHGMEHLVVGLHTSAYVGSQKRTGKLFDWLLSGHQSSDGLLHVGDDPRADGIMPASRGIRSVVVFDERLMCSRDRLRKAGDGGARTAALGAHLAFAPRNTAEDLGFARFGPAYTGFVHSVAASALEDGVSSVWFLAREGWLLREIYETVRAGHLVDQAPPSAYLYASRVASLRARLKTFGPSEVALVHSDTWKRSYASTLSLLQQPLDVLSDVLGGVGLAPDDHVTEQGLELLARHVPFTDLVRKIGEEERVGLAAYLERSGFPKAGRVAVVDVGWGGQIQENLQAALRMIGYETELVGYYLGTDERAAERRARTGMTLRGLVIDKCSSDGRGLGAFSHVQGLEIATRAPHGSVKGYGMVGDPRLAPASDRGRLLEAQDDALIACIQEGVLEYASRYVRIASVLGVRSAWSVDLARDVIDVAALLPTPEEATVQLGMKNVANLGGDEALNLGARLSVLHPRHAVRMLRSTLWQEGTVALMAPFVGPLALLALRVVKRKTPVAVREGLTRREAPSQTTAHDVVVADLLEMDLTRKRRQLAAGYAGSLDRRRIPLLSASDHLKLVAVRIAHRASPLPAIRLAVREVRTIIYHVRNHPRGARGLSSILRG